MTAAACAPSPPLQPFHLAPAVFEWTQTLVRAVGSGAVTLTPMDFDDTTEEAAFRREANDWLAAHAKPKRD